MWDRDLLKPRLVMLDPVSITFSVPLRRNVEWDWRQRAASKFSYYVGRIVRPLRALRAVTWSWSPSFSQIFNCIRDNSSLIKQFLSLELNFWTGDAKEIPDTTFPASRNTKKRSRRQLLVFQGFQVKLNFMFLLGLYVRNTENKVYWLEEKFWPTEICPKLLWR